MHLMYRSKKQTLPIVNDLRLAPYCPNPNPIPQPSPTSALFSRKKSIDFILEKHPHPSNLNINDQILIYHKPVRKTTYRPQKNRKAESGYLKNTVKIDFSQNKFDSKALIRNRSSQLNEKHQTIHRRKGESEYSPYLMGQSRKSKSNSKFKSTLDLAGAQSPAQRDWICEKFIEQEVYAVEEENDFC